MDETTLQRLKSKAVAKRSEPTPKNVEMSDAKVIANTEITFINYLQYKMTMKVKYYHCI